MHSCFNDASLINLAVYISFRNIALIMLMTTISFQAGIVSFLNQNVHLNDNHLIVLNYSTLGFNYYWI